MASEQETKQDNNRALGVQERLRPYINSISACPEFPAGHQIPLRASRLLNYAEIVGSRYLAGFAEATVVTSMHPMLAKAVLVLAAFLAVTPCIQACTGPKELELKVHAHPDANAYTELGNWFGDHKQYECALETFQNGLKLEPGSAKLDYLVGLTLYASGHPQEALKPLVQSIKLMPEVLKPHLLLAAVLETLEHRQEAREQWGEALRLDHNSIEAFDGIANSLLADGDYTSAIEVLQQGPRSETLTVDLAMAYGKGKMLDKAAEVLTQALKARPSSMALTSALVTVYVRQQQYQSAVRLAEKMARLQPTNLEAQRLYLRVLVLDGELVQARPLARRLLAAHPHDFDFLYLSGILDNQQARYAIARTHLQEAVSLNPDYYNARYNLGLALLELKDYSGAREQLEKALELGASEPQVRFKYATVLRTLGETDKAKEQLKLYQDQIQTNERRALAASKTAQAEKELSTGETEKAIADYRTAVEATPEDPQLNYKLAMALDKGGDTAAERTALEQAIKLDPGFALAENQLGYLDSNAGDPTAAEAHFRAAVKASPGYTQAWISLAATLGMQARYPEAQEAVASALKLEPDNAEALQLRKDLTAAQEPH